ncbi:hypothetical protein ACE939_13070 [Aquimarina sp. W85]|uniref:hypothetical protein n=1 Tax=Aquimarina rhodophyticola TaxID=3342246 RepID=UPI00366DF976
MFNKKILLFPQNQEHVLNMLPVVEELKKKGFKCVFINTSSTYHQKLYFFNEKPINIDALSLKKSFYKLTGLERIKFLFSIKANIKELTENYDFFVFGNDGAVQRLVTYYALERSKPSILILDGLISEYSFKFWDVIRYSNQKFEDLKEYFYKTFSKNLSIMFSGKKWNPFLPSIIGSSKVSEIYTIGEHSKSVLESYKNKQTTIYSYGLPRMSNHFHKEEDESLEMINNSICFITSAYKWHGLSYYDANQHKDIRLIISIISKLSPSNIIKLYIKLHPRESIEDYEIYKAHKNVCLVVNESMSESFKKYNLFLSNMSTAIVEGNIRGIIVHSMMLNFPYWKFKESFLGHENIQKIFKVEDLEKVIKDTIFKNKIKIPNSNNRFLSEKTKNSAKLISANIEKLINQMQNEI